jgi:hypothetical protein
MLLPRIAISAIFAAGLAGLPLSAANAQYYGGPPCTPFPLTWPFCIVGAVVGTAATIVSAPFRAAPYYYGYQQPYYGAPAASAYPPAYYPPPAPYYPPR